MFVKSWASTNNDQNYASLNLGPPQTVIKESEEEQMTKSHLFILIQISFVITEFQWRRISMNLNETFYRITVLVLLAYFHVL